MFDVNELAGSGATAIISAMASDAWSWARMAISQLLAHGDAARADEEDARLAGFANELGVTAERDVHNRLHGYLDARLSVDQGLREPFLVLVRKICTEVGIEPPTYRTVQHIEATNSVVVQTVGGNSHVHVVAPAEPIIRWAAMTGPEAARKLEVLDLADAVEALADMEPALAARRLSYVQLEWAQELLSHMDEGLAADLLAKMTAPEKAAELLAHMRPTLAAAILDLAHADWAVARLAEMDPDRALVLLASMGTKRTENLLAAMERQHTVRLLGAVSKVLADQARVRTTFDLAQQEAERIAAQARKAAQETVERASAEAERIKEVARQERIQLPPVAPIVPPALPGATLRPASPIPAPRVPLDSAVAASPRVSGAHRAGDSDTEFRLHVEVFLIAHGLDGRPRVNQEILETVIFGAVLCELVCAGLVKIDDGRPVPVEGKDCKDAVAEFALRSLEDQAGQSVAIRSKIIRRELFLFLAQALADDGTVVPVTRNRLWMRSPVCYRPTDVATANRSAVRLVRHLIGDSNPVDERTYLLAALVEIAQMYAQLPIDLRPRQVRELMTSLLSSRRLPADLHAVLAGVDEAVGSVVLVPGLR